MIILDASVYNVDYSKAEFKTFCHVGVCEATGEEFADLYDYDGFKALCTRLTDGARVFSQVLQAVAEGKQYVGILQPREHKIVGETLQYQEIQWD